MRFQFKYGFYYVYAAFSVLYVILLLLFPDGWREKAGCLMIYSDPAALGLLFMGAIVLLEKSQRVLNALAVSPVKVFEYILSKILSLCVISVLVAWALAVTAELDNISTVLLTTALTSIIFTLLGLIVATRINSLNQYLFASIPLEIICFTPPVIFLFSGDSVMRYFPLNMSMALLSGYSRNPIIDMVVLLIVIVCLYVIAHRQTVKMWLGN